MDESQAEASDACLVPRSLALLLCLLCLCSTACDSQFSHRRSQTDPLVIGRRIFLDQCATCHGKEGQGLDGKVPPLAAAPFVTGPPTRLTALVLDGLRGRQTVRGSVYRGVMPAWRGVLTSPEIAAVLTYVRQSWGNKEPAISNQFVSGVGNRFGARRSFWTAEELRALPEERKDGSASGEIGTKP